MGKLECFFFFGGGSVGNVTMNRFIPPNPSKAPNHYASMTKEVSNGLGSTVAHRGLSLGFPTEKCPRILVVN